MGIADHIVVAIAGITADANILVDDGQLNAARYAYKYQQDIPVEMCVHDTCNYTQYFTQFGGLRPFGVSMLWAGYNAKDGFQLFHSDPSGNYAEWKGTAIGKNNKSAQGILKEEFKDDLDIKQGVELCLKILTKTSDSPNLDAEQLEMFVMTLDEQGRPIHKQLETAELKKNID